MKFYYRCTKCGDCRPLPTHTPCGSCSYQAELTGPSTAETLASLVNTITYRGPKESQFVVVVHATPTLEQYRYVITQNGKPIAQGDSTNDVFREFCIARGEASMAKMLEEDKTHGI